MARRIKDIPNVELLKRFETLCFQITNYPNNKTIANDFKKIEAEMCRRLGCTMEDLEKEYEGV